jgi:hypothetical protein
MWLPCVCSCRLALVAAFLVSPFGAAERTWKPFNPLLGETFELEGLGSGVAFMAEQVRQCLHATHTLQCTKLLVATAKQLTAAGAGQPATFLAEHDVLEYHCYLVC